jgi:hypothetical protein
MAMALDLTNLAEVTRYALENGILEGSADILNA